MPSGAQAGDLILENCEYSTEAGSYDAECGTLVVPDYRADPDSRRIALPVSSTLPGIGRPAIASEAGAIEPLEARPSVR